MYKKSILWILLGFVFLAVFNIIFFVTAGIIHPVSVWISYGFIHFSYFMLIFTPLLVKNSTKATVLGFSLYSISAIYFLLAFFVGIIFILIRPESFKASLSVQVILAGAYATLLIANLLANEYTADSIRQHSQKLKFIKSASARTKLIIEAVCDAQLKKQVEHVYDLLHSSPSKSNKSVQPLESAITELLDELSQNIDSNDITAAAATINIIIKNINERNQLLKVTQ